MNKAFPFSYFFISVYFIFFASFFCLILILNFFLLVVDPNFSVLLQDKPKNCVLGTKKRGTDVNKLVEIVVPVVVAGVIIAIV
jgi:hypothetical protein